MQLVPLHLAVTPANTYMWTHNAPGPGPPDADESMVGARSGGKGWASLSVHYHPPNPSSHTHK
jgi:hypothetical protein